MTRKEYFRLLEEAWEKLDKHDLAAIRRYNRWKWELRKQLLEEE